MSEPYIFDTGDYNPVRDALSPEDRAFLAGLVRSFLAGLSVALNQMKGPEKALEAFDSSTHEFFGSGLEEDPE